MPAAPLSIINLKMNDVYFIIYGTNANNVSLSGLCWDPNIDPAGLNETYCTGISDLRTSPYSLNKFRGYQHSIIITTTTTSLFGTSTSTTTSAFQGEGG